MPQLPQLYESLLVSVQMPEHSVWPDWHPHTPGEMHASPELQQIEPQATELLPHAAWHVPLTHACPLVQQSNPQIVWSDAQLGGQLLVQFPLNEPLQ
jgi:hypothetical protein